jgi:hypothetical protein
MNHIIAGKHKFIYLTISVVSMIEVYPTVQVNNRWRPLLYSEDSGLAAAAKGVLPAVWFATSLATNIVVTSFIISRIFRQLTLPASLTT